MGNSSSQDGTNGSHHSRHEHGSRGHSARRSNSRGPASPTSPMSPVSPTSPVGSAGEYVDPLALAQHANLDATTALAASPTGDIQHLEHVLMSTHLEGGVVRDDGLSPPPFSAFPSGSSDAQHAAALTPTLDASSAVPPPPPAASDAISPQSKEQQLPNPFSHHQNAPPTTPATSSSSSSSSSRRHRTMNGLKPNTPADGSFQDQQASDRPVPVRRKSTLLLEGENEPEIDEDMDFNKLNIATGEPVGKPLSRAGSGDEIQLGDEEAAEDKYDTIITWQQGGNKVYVTGSFTGWRKMIKLNKQHDGTFSIVLKLPNGTHRMRFVVDNELRCSDFLPSATDSMGNLVNYIEVPSELDGYAPHSAGTIPSASTGTSTTASSSQPRSGDVPFTSAPQDPSATIPASAGPTTQATQGSDYGNQQADESMEPIHRVLSHTNYENIDSKTQDQAYPDDAPRAKLTRATTAEKVADYDMSNDDELLNGGGYERFQEELPADPVYKFTSEIPTVFTDPEAMEQFVSSDFVTPPQLPPHLESVILNSNSNEKDNNSVLPIPNHVVLNHLATTSIKHNVLAVASISRYSRKYVTQILYAPL